MRILAEAPHLDRDRYLMPELARPRKLVQSGLLKSVEAEVAPLA